MLKYWRLFTTLHWNKCSVTLSIQKLTGFLNTDHSQLLSFLTERKQYFANNKLFEEVWQLHSSHSELFGSLPRNDTKIVCTVHSVLVHACNVVYVQCNVQYIFVIAHFRGTAQFQKFPYKHKWESFLEFEVWRFPEMWIEIF